MASIPIVPKTINMAQPRSIKSQKKPKTTAKMARVTTTGHVICVQIGVVIKMDLGYV